MGGPECERLGHARLQTLGWQSSRKSLNLIVHGTGQPSPDNFISSSRINAPIPHAQSAQYQRYILAKSILLWLPPLRAKTVASVEAK
jgi:hypothetical protein